MSVGPKAIPMEIHVDDEMTCAEGSELDAAFNDGSYPTLYVWNQGSFTDGLAVAAAAQTETSLLIAEAGGVADYTVTANTITVNVSAQLFTDVVGDYYVAAYLLESGLNFPQNVASGTGSAYDDSWIHDHVLRASGNGSAWGEQFVFANGLKGDIFKQSYSLEKNPSWNMSNMQLVTVIWKYDGTDYTFINARAGSHQVAQ
jgi:hypothetical protein